MYNFLQHGLKSTFPSVETLLRIYLTIPISNATGERSFSALKRIKNVQRNMIGQIRLNALAILNIESDETKKIDFDEVINEFAKRKCRKKKL